LTEIKPGVSHFQVFGREAWAHISNEKWKTLQPKSKKCFFVGPNLMFMSSLAHEPSSTFMPSFSSIMVSSLDDDNEDENPPLFDLLPPN
jgi:hypothetical protein